MTIEDRVRSTLHSMALQLPDPESITQHPLHDKSRHRGLKGLRAGVIAFAATLILSGGLVAVLHDSSPSLVSSGSGGDGSGAERKPVSPFAFTLESPDEDWRIGVAVEDRDGNRIITFLASATEPVDREGVLPTLSLSVGPLAELRASEIETGIASVERTFSIQDLEAWVVATGLDSNGLDSGVVVWRSPEGIAVVAEYDRLDHQAAQHLLQRIRPFTNSEWSGLIDG